MSCAAALEKLVMTPISAVRVSQVRSRPYSVVMASNFDTQAQAYAPVPPIFAKLGLAYDDVLLLPNETDVIPSEVDTTTHLTREITMKTPAISAAMAPMPPTPDGPAAPKLPCRSC